MYAIALGWFVMTGLMLAALAQLILARINLFKVPVYDR
jgi:hypothetical protein